jgi:1,4-dihydroxy-2-naphthoyl-CoA hydrolase
LDLETVNEEFRGPFTEYLGLTFTELSPSKVVATWTAGRRHHQPTGIVHGGVHCGVVETLGSIGALAWLGDRGRCVGVSNTTDFYRSVSEGEMVSTGVPVHQGRLQQVWVVETHDADGRLVARGQLRVQNLTG